MRSRKVKDLNQHLTKVTGLNKDERAEWRACIDKLMKTDKVEAFKVFQSFTYWKSTYAKTELSK